MNTADLRERRRGGGGEKASIEIEGKERMII
jgi:hypothetical protein